MTEFQYRRSNGGIEDSYELNYSVTSHKFIKYEALLKYQEYSYGCSSLFVI